MPPLDQRATGYLGAITGRSAGGPPVLYRFSKPQDERFPAILLNNSCISYTAGASWKPRVCRCPNAHDLINAGASAPKELRIQAQGKALGKPSSLIPAF